MGAGYLGAGLIVLTVLAGLPQAARAVPSVVRFSFEEQGFEAAYSARYAAGRDILFQKEYGGYRLSVSGASSAVYGESEFGTDPFLSFAVQLGNLGGTPPSYPIRIGMTITGLTAPSAALAALKSSFTGIFQSDTSASFETYFDPANKAFGQAITLARFDGLGLRSNSFDATVLEAVTQPFSMSIFTTLTPAAYGHPTLDGQLTVTPANAADTPTPSPEPASAALVAAGLAGLYLVRRARRPARPEG